MCPSSFAGSLGSQAALVASGTAMHRDGRRRVTAVQGEPSLPRVIASKGKEEWLSAGWTGTRQA
jgi:hypothetical protein